jgi:type II secretory pathway pseudopilin PulG
MKRHQAFTMVELLVIVGIIAVLIAMLLPAMQRANAESQLADCAKNLMTIGRATINYVADNQGFLPQRQDDGIEPLSARNDQGDPFYYSSLNFRRLSKAELGADAGPPLASLPSGWTDPGANIGRLIVTGYLGKIDLIGPKAVGNTPGSKDPSDFYLAKTDVTVAPIRFCPSQVEKTRLVLSWQSSYLFNPHWANMVPGMSLAFGGGKAKPIRPLPPRPSIYTGIGTPVTAFIKLSQYPQYFCLACDMCYNVGNTTYHEKPEDVTTWNLLFPDGHVQSVQLPIVRNMMLHRGPDAGFYRLDDYIDMLETVAVGNDPVTKIAIPGFEAMQPAMARFPNPMSQYREGAYHAITFVNRD